MIRDDLNPEVRARADALKAELTADATTGVASDNDKAEDVFSRFLPAEINMDSVRIVQEQMLTFTAATALAHGELQQEHMLKHPELKSGSLKVKIGHSTIETSYERERSGVAMGKEWKKFGVAVTDFTLGTGRKRTDHKQVVAYLGEEAAKVFSN